MSEILATYSFLPWLRQGIAGNITQADGASVKLRASIPVKVTVSGLSTEDKNIPEEVINRNVEIYGPGDIIGIDARSIIKVEPRNNITNFEPNYLPYIDFYEEDFPWRYTPAGTNTNRLRPWLTLVVLKTDEFEESKYNRNQPLPSFKLKPGKSAADIFPKASELWAWAHVHVNDDLSKNAAPNEADSDKVNKEISNIISKEPDKAYSRIISPRKLETNTTYYAFLIPTFETGRLAGLGRKIDADTPATESAWDNKPQNIEFPYYSRWTFGTGNVGDFEYLVNLLKPKAADKSVGVRDMDVLHPGYNLPAIDDSPLSGVLKLGGALRVPFDSMREDDKDELRKYDEWMGDPETNDFSSAMASRINLADSYTDSTKDVEEINRENNITFESVDGDPDPVITSPLYGQWHALQKRLLKDREGNALPHKKNWIHELNLDPRFRATAGIGTRVVQKNQEEYMHASWEQVGKIVEANNKIRWSSMAMATSLQIYSNKLLTQSINKSLVFTAPVHKRVMYQQLTVSGEISESIVPSATTSGAFRKITAARSVLAKRASKNRASGGLISMDFIEKINNEEIQVVPPKTDPEGGINLAEIETDKPTSNVPGFVFELLKKFKNLKKILLIILFILIVLWMLLSSFAAISQVIAFLALICAALYFYINKADKESNAVGGIAQEEQTPETVDSLPKSPNFEIVRPGVSFTESFGNSDSIEAVRFKNALKDVFELVQTKSKEPERSKLDIPKLSQSLVYNLNPALTIPKRVLSSLKIPARIRENMVDVFTPVMVYPEIDIPMYKPLAELSSDLFLPNINKIEQNSLTLLENNQKFIESYMVGINHEMSRELLWREFPTDQRGTYFRQFWDVKSALPQPVPEDIKETLRDIPPIHKWPKVDNNRVNATDPNSIRKNELGSHNQRALASGKTQLVLVIRGELLKKYPTAVIYAQKADWGKTNGIKDVNAERVLAEMTESENINPPESKLKTPMFEAKIDPDIYFFGFDLDDEEARGTLNPQNTSDDAGWFFILKERPGEPRFGLDVNKADKIINWNNLSWEDIGTVDGHCIELNKHISLRVNDYDPDVDQENLPNDDDVQAGWSPNTNSAELAYILYQVPVMVAVHASRMLP